MVRYLVKTQTQSWGALDKDQIQRLVSRGHVGPDALVRDVPEGAWIRLIEHPILSRLLKKPAKKPTQKPRHIPRTSREGPPRIWVKTPQSIVQVRDRAMLERPCVMGVLTPVHGVGHERSGPFSPLGQHPDFQHLFSTGPEGQRVPTMNPNASAGPPQDPGLQTPISQEIIALNSADLEPVNTDSDVIALTTHDFKRIEAATSPSVVALSTPGWEAFRRKMNATSERLRQGDNQHDLTWDLFRSMMERAEPERSGPSEHTWNRFRHRIQERADAGGRKETTWDRFRHLIHDGPHPISNQTWALFVRALRQRRARASHRPVQPREAIRWPRSVSPRVGQAVVGEARIKSMVVRRDAIRRSPSIELKGLKVKTLTPGGSSKR